MVDVSGVVVMNPECRDKKHSNCDGRGWDTGNDEPRPCPCRCHAPDSPSTVRRLIIEGLRAKGYELADDAPMMICYVDEAGRSEP